MGVGILRKYTSMQYLLRIFDERLILGERLIPRENGMFGDEIKDFLYSVVQAARYDNLSRLLTLRGFQLLKIKSENGLTFWQKRA